jgi:hypothetical protein
MSKHHQPCGSTGGRQTGPTSILPLAFNMIRFVENDGPNAQFSGRPSSEKEAELSDDPISVKPLAKVQ